jgi:KDO2-lipid IV(A) lauroyltransferase
VNDEQSLVKGVTFMAKERSAVADYLVYLAVRIVVCIIQSLAYETTCQLAEGLAWLLHRIDHRHRRVAHDNLSRAFPEQMTEAQQTRLVSSVYAHFCRLLMQMIHLPRKVHHNTWARYIHVHDASRAMSCLMTKRPLLVVTAHYGNWELGGYFLGLLGFRLYAIARPLDNRYLDKFLLSFRRKTGQRILNKNGDFEQMQAILAGGGKIATLGDQDAGQRGLFVDFFGRPASTHKAIALLALQYRVPLVVLGMRRIGEPLRHEAVIEDLILPEEYDDNPNAVKEMTQRFTLAIERMVRVAPEQYFWLHRRWKHEPPRKKARKSADEAASRQVA